MAATGSSTGRCIPSWWPGCATIQKPAPYAARRTSEGKSTREIRRCLKRAVARQLFKLRERYDLPAVELIKVA